MTLPYVTPTGGSRRPTPKPGPTHLRIPMIAWRQPLGGVRGSHPPKPGA
jgi:hypothetical protein